MWKKKLTQRDKLYRLTVSKCPWIKGADYRSCKWSWMAANVVSDLTGLISNLSIRSLSDVEAVFYHSGHPPSAKIGLSDIITVLRGW